jgi:acetyl esterase/lipase
VQDAQRAVRWIREHAEQYGIDATRLAAVGGSSGGYLALMLGLQPGVGNETSVEPVDRQSSKVQCVVALAPATDLTATDWPIDGASTIASFIGKPRWPEIPAEYSDASPISHVKSHAGTVFLLIHGDHDEVVPCSQSATLTEKLRDAEGRVEFIKVEGGIHGIPPLVSSTDEINALPHPLAIAEWLSKNL